MQIEVIRGEGDKQAEDLIDELCTAENAGLQKGRCFLDENGFNKIIYDMSIAYQELPACGSVVRVSDASLGQSFYGKLTGYTINIEAMDNQSPLRISTSLSVERSVGA